VHKLIKKVAAEGDKKFGFFLVDLILNKVDLGNGDLV
jgi:hypothetical protein